MEVLHLDLKLFQCFYLFIYFKNITKSVYSTDNLEAALARCGDILGTLKTPLPKTWETRMSHLSSNWDSTRKLLLEAVLSCESLPFPEQCQACFSGKVSIRCHDCPKKFFCPSCDNNIHSSLPFHNRDGYVDGFFEAIPPTVSVDENGDKQNIGKYFLTTRPKDISLIQSKYISDHRKICQA